MPLPSLDTFVGTAGAKPSLDSFVSSPVAAPAQPSTLQKVGNVVNSIFPGKQIGTAIGNSVYGIGQALQGNSAGYNEAADANSKMVGKVAGDLGQSVLTAAAPLVGGTGSTLAKIGANTALGAGLGGTNAIAQGKGVGDVAKSAALGGAVGGGVSAVSEGAQAIANNLPNWLTKAALPKLDNKNLDYALQNTKIGSLATLQKNSNASMNSYENSIQSILNHPEFKDMAADSESIIGNSLSQFGNSDYRSEDLISNAKNIAPNVSKLITKFDADQANIQEVNTIRKELDAATKSVYTSLNRPPEAKLLGASLANSMRNYVQTSAPETAPIFQNYSKEIGLNKAIGSAVKKGEARVSLKDIAAGTTGFMHNGFSGALEGIILERALTNPGIQLGVAKAVQGAGKAITPAASAALQGLKAPIIKGITNQSS